MPLHDKQSFPFSDIQTNFGTNGYKQKMPLFTAQLLLMGNKCAFLQHYPDAPILHVEKLSAWIDFGVSEA